MAATVRELARLERAEFADMLDRLTPQQWGTPSLCTGWTVRDVVAHTIAYLAQSRIGLLANMTRSRWDVNRLNATALRTYAETAPTHLVGLMRRHADPSGAGALYGGRVALIECLIHQQDIRRPLGMPRMIPEQRLRVSLSYARISPVIGGSRRTRGVRLVATDISWSTGRGPEVHGSAEALLLAMTGRAPAVADELEGDGVALLR
ncbi:maleylpyruvate isomerase family mycothiol-dependent enzyme [Nocardia terpenica]|uniref:maleylpyruvate isomerase family mycothiol-dependent enzyme n=1 Tax=Nocardia terpenica TaxID=455432 RepID=UPI00189477BE|nr:maleylpyruvate isomerase family mycothiol-dependent enzyme [Nocardia terpenica]MBF6061954.1 maleylpyruvate isomerase family mycothiol-dependent enzyme [Nocardia terpenica]MBF6106246.1 maleylpyruvate isomerase family mycothiol-dependent enzyme [Nocardia terpenica]MBF6110374.1 maleylpyruvate isomerase family mycothiol-dependent enzyme [Nocardia terpenica]MBF6120789.1 maleylpyruvate isomerase family mycothiol-dependent enzyme [Nocardia terpenica]MBF6151710.1 maleylpyruvate isomerase family myc